MEGLLNLQDHWWMPRYTERAPYDEKDREKYGDYVGVDVTSALTVLHMVCLTWLLCDCTLSRSCVPYS